MECLLITIDAPWTKSRKTYAGWQRTWNFNPEFELSIAYMPQGRIDAVQWAVMRSYSFARWGYDLFWRTNQFEITSKNVRAILEDNWAHCNKAIERTRERWLTCCLVPSWVSVPRRDQCLVTRFWDSHQLVMFNIESPSLGNVKFWRIWLELDLHHHSCVENSKSHQTATIITPPAVSDVAWRGDRQRYAPWVTSMTHEQCLSSGNPIAHGNIEFYRL